MAWLDYLLISLIGLFVLTLGLIVGSFLNVLIARLPYEKSIVWPSSRCFSCFRPVRFTDNIPILGFLRLRGKCRYCGAPFSSRYLAVEMGTGVAFLALFIVEVVLNWYHIRALGFNFRQSPPPWQALILFAYHAFLLSGLIAAAVIDAEHRIIPALIPYTGVVVGLIGGALMPWPWPAANSEIPLPLLNPNMNWMLSPGKVPLGVQPWPFWGPPLNWAPPGSFQMGLITAALGALAGSLVVRVIKKLFEVGFGREAMGLGDADLLMMAGAFLGWQIAVLSLFVGAVSALALKVLGLLFLPAAPAPAAGTVPAEGSRELPFGPGLALGVVITWLSWPWLGAQVQAFFFDTITIGISGLIMCVGMVAAGLLLRRPDEGAPPEAAKN